ncbi:MAG TPA: DUF2917 domain-containing protein [Ramlibacter sp.]|nr:DUF2917 domain-containing protein [Ramlibacter sp.]
MTSFAATPTHPTSPRLPGTWRLDAARAVTLRPKEDGVMRIAHGRVWVTFDGPHRGHLNQQGDRILGAGQQVRVRAGQRLVLESCDTGQPAYFSWDFMAAPLPVRRFDGVLQPWQDLQLALALAVRASWRLAKALVHLGVRGLLPRPQGAAA